MQTVPRRMTASLAYATGTCSCVAGSGSGSGCDLAAGAVGRLLFRGIRGEQRDLQHVLHVLDEVEGHVALDRLGDLDEVALVELRQDHAC